MLMARFARVVVPGCPHHITHRGNRRDPVFFSEEDRLEYLEILLEYSRQYALEILGYCLMTTHVHLIGIPEREESLGLAIGRAHMKYARHANRRQQWWGHLWANRFYSTPLDEAHCWQALKYVERNPVRAGLIDVPWEYPWSSARAHVLGIDDPLLTHNPLAASFPFGATWGACISAVDDSAFLARLRTNTNTGWPAGSAEFVATLEVRLDRRLTRQKAGRKPKQGGNT
jgi:putative transposase